ncbi:MAG: HlyD family type I secretion periplasmic adaptor subunit, partial [Alphaproteobacteria bacterium]
GTGPMAGPATAPRQRRWWPFGAMTGRARFADFLPDTDAVVERERSPLGRFIIWTVAILLVAAVTWAGLASVDRVSSASGVVRPFSRVKVINHSESARVADIYIRDGDRVVAGQPLLALDPAFVEQEVAKQRSAWFNLQAEEARLEAEAIGDTPIYPDGLLGERPDLVRTQNELYEARQASLQARRAAADQVIAQRRNEVAAIEQGIARMERSLVILREQESALAELVRQEYFPRLRYLTVQRDLSELEGELAGQVAQLAGARAALAEAADRRRSTDREWRADTIDRLAQVTAERERVEGSLEQQQARQRDLIVRAPVDGIVQNLAVASSGQSVPASVELMRIVPTGETLIVEAQVPNRDIGFIHVGQPVRVKIRTYDFLTFGALDGTVERIAADATLNEATGNLTFPVLVRTERAWLGETPGDLPVTPGMAADVEFILGERTVLSFLTDRILRTTSTALTQR